LDVEYLLEEEVIVNELLLGGGIHAVERVEGTGEVTIELVASLDDLVHDLHALLVGDSWSEGELSQVTANSDTGGLDEGTLFLAERRAVEAVGVHVGDVVVCGAVVVVLLDDLVEEGVEGLVGVLGAGVAADSRVDVLAAREDASLERNTASVALVVILLPNVFGEVLGDERLAVGGELRPSLELFR